MYEIAPDVNLGFLKGKEICQVCFGLYDVQFNYGNGGITVTGKFVFYSDEGHQPLIWKSAETEEAGRRAAVESALIISLLGTTVENVSWQKDGQLDLTFSSGAKLQMLNDDPRYEAYVINDGKQTFVV